MKEIIQLSLKEDNFSSHILLKTEEIFDIKTEDYNIPSHFNQNIITVLPVDPRKFFLYWDTDKDYKNMVLKLYVEDKEVISTKIYNRYGSLYLHYHAPFKKVYATLTLDDEIIIKSNEIVAPSDVLHYEEEELWFNKDKNIYTKKETSIKMEELIEIFSIDLNKNKLPSSF